MNGAKTLGFKGNFVRIGRLRNPQNYIMAKRSSFLPASRFAVLSAIRAVAASIVLATCGSAFADNISDAKRLIKQGQLLEAMDKVDGYLASNPKDPQGRFLKGTILTDMNKAGEAIEIFTKLTEDYPELPEPYNNLAVLYAGQNQLEKARFALETAIKAHPSYAVAHENLGDIYVRLASQSYGKALQIDNTSVTLRNKVAALRELIESQAAVRPKASTAESSQRHRSPRIEAPIKN